MEHPSDLQSKPFRQSLDPPTRGILLRDRRRSYVLLSPRECHISIMEVPPVPGGEIGKLVKYRLRSEYPGNGASDVDWRRNGKRSVVATATPSKRLSLYRSAAPGSVVFSPFSIALALSSGRKAVVAIGYDGRYEVFGVDRRRLVFLSQPQRTDLADTLGDALAAVSSTGRGVDVYYVSDDADAADFDRAGFDVVPVSLNDAVIKAAKSAKPLFTAPSAARRHALPVVVVALLLGIILSGAAGTWRRFSALKIAETRAAVELADAQARYAEVVLLADEVAALESAVAESARPLHPYETISTIAGSLDTTVKIEQLTVRGARFEFSARGASGLDVLEALRKNPLVTDVEIRHVTALDDSAGERFVVAGALRDE